MNVVAMHTRHARQPLLKRLARHAGLFGAGRRRQSDVFWLKENAEFLNILQSTKLLPDKSEAADTLRSYEEFYHDLGGTFAKYPQYYRFLLSICLDFEDLCGEGTLGQELCAKAYGARLFDAELSDLQRAEAYRLLARRDVGDADDALGQRLRAFIARQDTFAIPNKKAAYELTHIVFYLSEYGSKDPELDQDAIGSLHLAGVLAFLEQNTDLLAEICIALRYARQTPPSVWEEHVARDVNAAQAVPETSARIVDDYHPYLMGCWLDALRGQDTFGLSLGRGGMRITLPASRTALFGKLLSQLDDLQSADWQQAQQSLVPQLTEQEHQLLQSAIEAVPDFPDFFARFSRKSGA